MKGNQIRTGQQARFVVCPTAILDDERVTEPSIVTVYLALSKFRDYSDRSCWPSRATIAKLAKVSPRTVDKAIETLQNLGYLSIESGKKTGKSNCYILTDPFGYGAQPLLRGCATVAQGGAQPLLTNDIHCNDIQERIVSKGHHTVIDEFFRLHEKSTGTKPVFLGKKHGGMVKKLLASMSEADCLAKLRAYYGQDWWFTKNGARSLEGFMAHINEVALKNDDGYHMLKIPERFREEMQKAYET